ncbi:MAG TPA: O-antigen ligase family protein [Phycisphaerales bacterium]|nr:O-antigen ligase family protein [Phycisphaerales bacterium]HIN84700.1 O-antigen ligase family protein [Phycisphaerales bacterium]
MPSLISENFLKKSIFLMPALFLFWHTGADAIATVIAILFLFHSGNRKNWEWTRKPWVIAAFSLWVYAITISSPLAVYPEASFKISFLFIRFIIFGAALAYWILQDKTTKKWFEYGVVSVVVFIIIDCFIQAYFGKDLFGYTKISNRLSGPFTDLVPGIYVTKLIFIALASIFYTTKFSSLKIKNSLLLSSMVVATVFLLLTGERTALLNFLLGCAIVFTGFFIIYPKLRFWILSGCIAMIISAGIVAVSNPAMRKRSIISTYETIADWPNSPYGNITRSAIDIWMNTPETNIFSGVGLRNYREIINDPKNASIKNKFHLNLDRYYLHPHNFYIEWLVGAGIIGFIGFSTMVVLILKDLIWRNLNSTKPALPVFATAVFMTTFWPLTFSMNYFTNKHAVIVWMTVGWALAVTMKKKNKNTS